MHTKRGVTISALVLAASFAITFDQMPTTKELAVSLKCDRDHQCEDGLWCTVEYCSGGECKRGDPRNCDDGDKNTVDTCSEVTDMCVNAQK